MGYIPKHNIYNNTFQIFLLDKALKRTAEYFVMFSKIEMGTSQITEIVPVWEYKGEGVEKNVFSFQDQRRTTQATNLQLPKSYVRFQKVKFGPLTSFRPSQVTGYRRTFADNKNTQDCLQLLTIHL